HGNGECETGKEKWKEVGMGHKWRFAWTRRLRRMMGVHLECAIMICGRERISLVIVYQLGLSVALKSMYSSSSDGSSITCLHRLFRCRSIGALYFEKEIRCDWISVFRRQDDLMV